MTASNSALAEWRHFWFLPFAAALGYSTSVIHVYSLGPFIEPLQQEFGWSRAQVSVGISIASFISAMFCIPIGIVVDRIGPRRDHPRRRLVDRVGKGEQPADTRHAAHPTEQIPTRLLRISEP